MRAALALCLTSLAAMAVAPAASAQNLVVNGNFENGNASFLSDYSYQALVNTPSINGGAAQYTVIDNARSWNGQWIGPADHTTGSGLMFVANGSKTAGSVVWEQTVNVSAGTNYFFEAWVMNTCCDNTYGGPNSPSQLTFMINGVEVGTRTTSLANVGTWEGLSSSWFSGGATTARLQLLNAQTALGGNDFAIDDISLSTVSTVSAVPEPSAYAMALVALGMLAVTARRARAR